MSEFIIENGMLIKYIGKDEEVTIPEGVTCIADGVFKGHREICKINFPSTLQKIGSGESICTSGVFDGCYKLSFGKDFLIIHNCLIDATLSKMENIIPDGVTSIHTDAVRIPGNEVPRTVIVPKTVKEVGQWAFSNAYVRFEGEIPKTIGTRSMFLSIPEDITWDGYWIDKGTLLMRTRNATTPIPEDVKRIATGAIVLKKGERLEIPSSVEVIEHDAIRTTSDTIAEVIIPPTVKVIEDNQESLPKASKITIIGINKSSAKTFAKCNGFKFASMDKGVPPLKKWHLKKRRDNTADLITYSGADKHVIIPDEVDGCIITSIGSYVFSGHQEIEEVTFPKGIKEIGSNAFSGCTNLHSVVIPNGVEFISWYAFQDSGLTEIVIPPSVEVIGINAFFRCPLSKIVLSDGQRLIGEKAFAELKPIKTVEVPVTVTEIQSEAFNASFGKIRILGDPKLGDNVFNAMCVVQGKANSRVESYCRRNGIRFEPLN